MMMLSRLPIFLLSAFLLSMGGVPLTAQQIGPALPPANPPRVAPNPNRELVRTSFRCMADFQMEVWLNGKRAGFTPFTVELKPGEYWFTASADSVEPVFQKLVIEEGNGETRVVGIPPAPITKEDYPAVYQRVQRMLLNGPKDPHHVLIALHLCIDKTEGRELIEVAQFGMKDDPMLDFHHGQVLLMEEKPEEALPIVERGLKKMDRVAFGWRTKAQVLIALDRLEEALEAANQSMILDPNCWRNLRIRAEVQQLLGNSNAAKADGERAQEMYELLLDPERFLRQ